MRFNKERRLRGQATTIVNFYADRDPRGFIEQMEQGETLDEAKARMVSTVYDYLVDRDFQPVIDMVYDPNISDYRMKSRMLDIMASIQELKRERVRTKKNAESSYV